MDFSEKGQKSSDEMPSRSAGPDFESDEDSPLSPFEEMCLQSLQEECKRLNKYIKRYGNGRAKEELEAIFKVEGIWHDKEDVSSTYITTNDKG